MLSKQRRTGLVVGIGVTVALAGWAWAQDDADQKARVEQTDKCVAGLGQGRGPAGFGRLAELDTDGDGKVSEAEREAFRAERRAAFEKQLLEEHPELDTDGDGSLSKEEMISGKEVIREEMRSRISDRMLERNPEADTDGDGVLSEEEIKAFREDRGPRNRSMRGSRGQRGMGGRGMFGGPPPAVVIEQLIQRFDAADTDSNGQLSKAELLAVKEKLSEMMPGPGQRGGRGSGMRGQMGADRPAGRQRMHGPGPSSNRQQRGGPGMRGRGMRDVSEVPTVVRERILKRWPKTDLNDDGQLSDDELEAFRKERMQQRRRQGGNGNGPQ